MKKRSALKSKAGKALSSSNIHVKDKKILKPSTEKTFLHLINTDTKKEKQLKKSTTFLDKLAEGNTISNNNNNNNARISSTNQRLAASLDGISKSALRRRKRKLRDTLKPKLNDLLDTLDSIDSSSKTNSKGKKTKDTSRGYINKQLDKHRPNPHKNLNSFKIISTIENGNFAKVLGDSTFRASPFQAIRDKIRLQNSLS